MWSHEQINLVTEFSLVDRQLLTMEPGAECEFCGERRADGRPLTGLEPFPPWNFAEKIKKGKDKNQLQTNETFWGEGGRCNTHIEVVANLGSTCGCLPCIEKRKDSFYVRQDQCPDVYIMVMFSKCQPYLDYSLNRCRPFFSSP